MAYDIHDQDENRTGLVAPFSVQPSDQGKYLEMNVVRKKKIKAVYFVALLQRTAVPFRS